MKTAFSLKVEEPLNSSIWSNVRIGQEAGTHTKGKGKQNKSSKYKISLIFLRENLKQKCIALIQ